MRRAGLSAVALALLAGCAAPPDPPAAGDGDRLQGGITISGSASIGATGRW